jgi:phytoene dehydrogenase-like protein
MTDVLVVGAGHNGLTAGCYLRQAGLDVLIVEAHHKLGGMTSTTATLPKAPRHLVNEGAMDASLWRTHSISRDLGLSRHGLREMEVDPAYAYLDPDGSSLCIHRDPRRTAEEIGHFCRQDASAFLDLANVLDSLITAAVPYLNSNPLRPNLPRVLAGAAKAALHPGRLLGISRLFTASHAEFIDERFTDRRLKAILAALPPFAPMFQDGTAWALMYLGLIHRFGAGRFIGGTGALTDALAKEYTARGGAIRLNAAVGGLVLRNGRVTGVRLETGEEITANAVMTTNSVVVPLTKWLPEHTLPTSLAERVRHIPTTATNAASFKVDLALSGHAQVRRHQENRRDSVDLRKPVLAYTNFEDQVQAWRDCARGEVPDPLPGMAVIPSAFDPTQAPEGQDTFWFWSGVSPARPREPWTEVADRTAERVLAAAGKYIDGLGELEIDRQVLAAPDFEARFRAPDGNVYHVDPIVTRFGPLRPAIGLAGYRTPVPGLFLSGGGTHPSGGICGVPGREAARAVIRSTRRSHAV